MVDEDLVDHGDALGFAERTEHEGEVLGVGKVGEEETMLLDEGGAVDFVPRPSHERGKEASARVRDIERLGVGGAERRRRKQLVADAAAGGAAIARRMVELVGAADDDVCLRMPNLRHHRLEERRLEAIVGIEQHEVFALGKVHSGIAGGGGSGVFLRDESEGGEAIGVAGKDFVGAVGRAVVDAYKLEIGVCLAEQVVETWRQTISHVIYRKDDGEGGRSRRSGGCHGSAPFSQDGFQLLLHGEGACDEGVPHLPGGGVVEDAKRFRALRDIHLEGDLFLSGEVGAEGALIVVSDLEKIIARAYVEVVVETMRHRADERTFELCRIIIEPCAHPPDGDEVAFDVAHRTVLGGHGGTGSYTSAIQRLIEERRAFRMHKRLKREEQVFVDDAFGKADRIAFDKLAADGAKGSVREELAAVLEECEKLPAGCDVVEAIALREVLDDAAVGFGILVEGLGVEVEVIESLGLEAFGDVLERMGEEHVVGIEKDDDASGGVFECEIARRALTGVDGRGEKTEALIASDCAFRDGGPVVGGAVVDNDRLEIAERLRSEGVEAFGDIALAIIESYDDGEGGGLGIGHKGSPLRRKR